jgi:hypothetical protein
LLSNWWKQCSLNDNPNAQKWRLQGTLLKIHRKDFSLAGGKASVCKKQNNIFSDTIYEKNEKPRKLIMNLVKQTFQTKANRLEELKCIYIISIFMPNTNSRCCAASPMSCCKML